MIKRRFYREEHGDRNEEASDSSSSSSSFSDSEIQESEDDEVSVAQVQDEAESCSTSSGYESEEISGNVIDGGLSSDTVNEEDAGTGNGRQIFLDSQLSSKYASELLDKQSNVVEENDSLPGELPDCVLKCKPFLKCRLCPRIVCLNEKTMRTHLQSKRHARSEKLLNDGRLKAMLNSDGEIVHEETPAKQHAQVAAKAQNKPKQKRGGRQRQHARRQKLRKKDKKHDSNEGKQGNQKRTQPRKGASMKTEEVFLFCSTCEK
ncbi:hypothetical protein FNV43_RR14011 [Rhamnella rubrinervis]|uniref:C2H2-type domain-containing protein n=1 Tax=Rhamnella rubrinervis TaxID=2594499 RepID=A0A8K0MFT7_9ROSA|nr:hypothetical protein FNV43_RR14011 [Rhamnella rubrinervis]